MKFFKLPATLGIILFCASPLLLAQNPPKDTSAVVGAVPAQQPGQHRRSPPAEAYAACADKTAGAAASFTNRKGVTVNGICRADKDGKLVVRPGPPAEAYAACADKTAGAAASFTNRKGATVNGICRADKEGKLVVRPGPPAEAYAACAGKNAGDAASFTNRKGVNVNGVCRADKEGKLIVKRQRSPK